jgi:hypothetical protein
MLQEYLIFRKALTLVVFLLFAVTMSSGQDHALSPGNQSNLAADTRTNSDENPIPPGTVLPVKLRNTISSDKAKPGQVILATVAQNVPLPSGALLREGSRVEGRVLEVSPNAISIRFDRVYLRGKAIPVTTNLRAIAGVMSVLEAGVPAESPSEGTPFNWLTTTQIGGDSVYGVGGPVMSAKNTDEVVGRSVNGGVLSRVSAKEGTKCRGPVAGNNAPQALWVFSSDACGVYGMEHVKIVHSGRTAPEGTFVLASDTRRLKLSSGDGFLLRVNVTDPSPRLGSQEGLSTKR